MEERISLGRINVGYHGTFEFLTEMLEKEQAKELIKMIVEDYYASLGEYVLDFFLAKRCARKAGFKTGEDEFMDTSIFYYEYPPDEEEEISNYLIDFWREQSNE